MQRIHLFPSTMQRAVTVAYMTILHSGESGLEEQCEIWYTAVIVHFLTNSKAYMYIATLSMANRNDANRIIYPFDIRRIMI